LLERVTFPIFAPDAAALSIFPFVVRGEKLAW